jgi:4-nitrophenyl phosphatase
MTMSHTDFGSIEQDPTIGAVVCGFDLNLNYLKLAKAFTYLNNKKQNPHFILTNDDSTFPAPNGIYPGTGSLVQPLIHALKRQPLVMGKPNKPMLDCFFAK